jgi:DNA cross-link repair 1A protein
MNAADICHEISDCPGLYVDAFRGRFLRRTQDPDSAFILTHYHGDHYQNLQREGKYKGPALIHCTPVTAALLVQVHQVPSTFVVEHEYGQTFEYCIRGKGKQLAKVTFYDANHCPGACIVLIQLPNGTTHLHTGDMRYHERFKSYPLLREAVANQQLDLVYLDTTYSHPKHDFVPQEEAVEAPFG